MGGIEVRAATIFVHDFEVVNVLVHKFEQIDLNSIKTYREASYKKGYGEPTFWSTQQSELATKRCPDQNKYKYCLRTMECNVVYENDAAVHRAMHDNYKFILESYKDIISDEVREVLEEGMKMHAPKFNL